MGQKKGRTLEEMQELNARGQKEMKTTWIIWFRDSPSVSFYGTGSEVLAKYAAIAIKIEEA